MANFNSDVEAIFIFIGRKRNKIVNSGYRPAHLINGYLTSGIQMYKKEGCKNINIGTITFLSPQYYPHTLYMGKIIKFYEGSVQTGYAIIIKVNNKLLQR